jgi:hypothetical protein
MMVMWLQYERWMRSNVACLSPRAYIASSVRLFTRTRPTRRSFGRLESSKTAMSVSRVQSDDASQWVYIV